MQFLRFWAGIALVLLIFFCGVAHAEEGAPSAPSAAPTPEMLKKTEAITAALTDIAPEGWVAAGPVEPYTVENIYDKINGRSELFMSYDLVGMSFVTIVPADTADKTTYVDIFLYDMANAQSAFGVYGVERSTGITPVALGREAYRTDTDLFLWQGQYYATLLGSGDEPRIQAAQQSMGETLAKRLKADDAPLWGMTLMPEAGRVEHSMQYFKEDAMSLDFMPDTYTANYNVEGMEMTFFLSRQRSEGAATKALEKYLDMFKKYGESLSLDEEVTPPIASADMGGGHFDVVFQFKHFICGVSGVEDNAMAVKGAMSLFNSVKDKLELEKAAE